MTLADQYFKDVPEYYRYMYLDGYTPEQINIVKQIFKIYFRSGLSSTNALAKIRTELPQTEEVKEFLDFCANTKKGVLSGNANGNRN